MEMKTMTLEEMQDVNGGNGIPDLIIHILVHVEELGDPNEGKGTAKDASSCVELVDREGMAEGVMGGVVLTLPN